MNRFLFTSIFILIGLCFALPSRACMVASQHRIFPLGKSDLGWVVLEGDLHRTDIGEFDAGFGGEVWLRTYSSNYELLSGESMGKLETAYPDVFLDSLKLRFRTALSRAKSLPGFQPLNPFKIENIGFQKEYEGIRLSVDEPSGELMVSYREEGFRTVSVLRDTTSIPSAHIRECDYYDMEYADCVREYYLGSVKVFRLGKQELIVVHLGEGQHFEMADGSMFPPGKYGSGLFFDELEETIFLEPVIHHGSGFDFMVWREV